MLCCELELKAHFIALCTRPWLQDAFSCTITIIHILRMIELMKNLNRHKIETDSIYFDPVRLFLGYCFSMVGIRYECLCLYVCVCKRECVSAFLDS